MMAAKFEKSPKHDSERRKTISDELAASIRNHLEASAQR